MSAFVPLTSRAFARFVGRRRISCFKLLPFTLLAYSLKRKTLQPLLPLHCPIYQLNQLSVRC